MPSKRPWSIQVELVEGCNRLCTFCGLNTLRGGTGDYKYMSEHTAERTAMQIAEFAPTARIEFAMHGEPLQHPKREKMFYIFRSYLPKTQMQTTTNGRVLKGKMEERIGKLFAAGLDFILMDTYRPERDGLREEALAITKFKVVDYYVEKQKGNAFNPYQNHRRRLNRTLVLLDDLLERSGERVARTMHNTAGNNPLIGPTPEPLERMCTLPFRELTITWAGEVRLCCRDWTGRYVCGNIHQTRLKDIWNGIEFEAARAHLKQKDRGFGPCDTCDAPQGTRIGLVPQYAEPTLSQRAFVKGHGKPFDNNAPGLVKLRMKKAASG